MKITISDKDYELKMTTRYMLQLEDDLGKNPLNIIWKMRDEQELPKYNDVLKMFHYCLLKFNHGLSFNDTLDLFDRYVSEGGTMMSLLETIIKVYIESGIIPEEQEEDSKN